MDLKTKLMELTKLEPKKVQLKTVDLEIYIKPLSFKDRFDVEKLENTDPLAAMAKLISATVCDKDGEQLFTMEDAEKLCENRAEHILEIVQHIYALHFIEEQDLEDEAKK